MRGEIKNFTLLTFFLFLIAVVFSGCAPIGGLMTSDVTDHLRVEPVRFVYFSDQDDPFTPAYDMKVFGVFKGMEKPIDIKDVDIIINDNDWGDSIVVKEFQKKEGIQLAAGIKDIHIGYKDMETLYRIYVGPEAGDSPGGGPSIIIDISNW
jgi:hypothetical protein